MFYSKTPKTKTEMSLANLHKIEPSLDDEPFVVTTKYHHRPDKLADDIYGNAKYMFVFALRNMDVMEDPIYDLVAGMTIMIPNPRTIQKLK